ncbi:hypothetical protein [Streptomyces sp. FIT100]|uniref:hypothetical protein n=1 Tax=Streptomyces sp. FIT100 TaxID=2837956 RepID=UPI0021C953C0|nr:hypothetical protein [Streptomyces sp. FIT100]UUN30078.1 hypothetical protein KK483_29730 [Streptomyces sp. FIT100]
MKGIIMHFTRPRSVRGPAAALAVLTLGAALVAAPPASAQPQALVCNLNEFEMHIAGNGNATGSASGSCQSPLQPDISRVDIAMEGTGSFNNFTATSDTRDVLTFRDDGNNIVASVEATERRTYVGPTGPIVEAGQAGALSGEPFTGCTAVEAGTATRSAADNAIAIVEGVDDDIPDLDMGFNACPEEGAE